MGGPKSSLFFLRRKKKMCVFHWILHNLRIKRKFRNGLSIKTPKAPDRRMLKRLSLHLRKCGENTIDISCFKPNMPVWQWQTQMKYRVTCECRLFALVTKSACITIKNVIVYWNSDTRPQILACIVSRCRKYQFQYALDDLWYSSNFAF